MALLARQDSSKQAFERGGRYVTRVNTGKLDVERHTDYLNKAWEAGYRLHTVFEQNGNTVMVFEGRD